MGQALGVYIKQDTRPRREAAGSETVEHMDPGVSQLHTWAGFLSSRWIIWRHRGVNEALVNGPINPTGQN